MAPAGLADQLTRAELVNLIAFLKALGRLPEYTVGTAPIARHWHALQPTDDAVRRLQQGDEELAAAEGEAFSWQSVYSRVNGSIPLEELPVIRLGDRHVRIVRLGIHSAAPDTPAALQLHTTDGQTAGGATGDAVTDGAITGWWNGQPLELDTITPVKLDKGLNHLTLAVDARRPASDLRIGLVEAVPGVRFAL